MATVSEALKIDAWGFMDAHASIFYNPAFVDGALGVCRKSVMNLFYGRQVKDNKKFIDDKYGSVV